VEEDIAARDAAAEGNVAVVDWGGARCASS